MPTFPSTLPGVLIEGYALSPVDQTARTDMESGAARVRRRTRARNDQIDVSWCFTPSQFGIFRAWFENESTGISGGASWFSLNVDVDGISSVKDVRFHGTWKSIRNETRWKITAKLEVR